MKSVHIRLLHLFSTTVCRRREKRKSSNIYKMVGCVLSVPKHHHQPSSSLCTQRKCAHHLHTILLEKKRLFCRRRRRRMTHINDEKKENIIILIIVVVLYNKVRKSRAIQLEGKGHDQETPYFSSSEVSIISSLVITII